jgi:hypothetical protein
LSGTIYAITATGAVSVVAKPKLPTGGDVGVESVGFVPAGFTSRGGVAYYADRFTKGNAHPGTDHLLRLPSAQLAAAGVQDGDMLVATEGGATMVAVRCASACATIPLVAKATKAHGEGHLAFTVNPPLPSPTPRSVGHQPGPSAPAMGPIAGIGILVVVAVVAAATAVILRRRRRPRA